MPIDPKNLTAQLSYQARGNPSGAHPGSAVGNFFPGLEFNFLGAWRRIFIGIELNESSGDVMGADPHADPELRELVGFQIIAVDVSVKDGKVSGGIPIQVPVIGPDASQTPPKDATLGQIYLEWGNALAALHHERGGSDKPVVCVFQHPDTGETRNVSLKVRQLFEPDSALISRDAVPPGELTQSLCSPWQTDFVGCACYYWAANRPDFINLWAKNDGSTGGGNNWLTVNREQRVDSESGGDKPFFTLEPGKTLKHEDIMRSQDWETKLRFVIGGKDETP
jgi:hypothetical protein